MGEIKQLWERERERERERLFSCRKYCDSRFVSPRPGNLWTDGGLSLSLSLSPSLSHTYTHKLSLSCGDVVASLRIASNTHTLKHTHTRTANMKFRKNCTVHAHFGNFKVAFLFCQTCIVNVSLQIRRQTNNVRKPFFLNIAANFLLFCVFLAF